MDLANKLDTWNRLLKSLESGPNGKNETKIFNELKDLFRHIPPEGAIRHQDELESCTMKTIELVCDVFDRIDCSDRSLLASFLNMLVCFGYFRISQITYHYRQPSLETFDQNPIYSPIIEKKKWYDMEPLLPKAGTLGWKGLMNSSLVKEETQLMPLCLQLLSQKLHFYSIINDLDQFQQFKDVILKNGKKITKKLVELIKDVAFNDEGLIGIDSHLFNILLPFVNEDQLKDVIEAIIQDLFKPFVLQQQLGDCELKVLYQLIREQILDRPNFQELFINGMIEHLKCNIIRRKRRHSVEYVRENGKVSLENLINRINNLDNFQEILSQTETVDLEEKYLQSSYLLCWTEVFRNVLKFVTLTLNSSTRLFATCSTILIVISKFASQDIIHGLSCIAAKSVDTIAPTKSDKFFNLFDPVYLIELTNALVREGGLSNDFDTPTQQFYRSYLNKYLRLSILRGSRFDTEKLDKFVTFICDKSLEKNTSYILQYICIRELASCVDLFKTRLSKKTATQFSNWARMCTKRLHRFIKRNSNLKDDSNNEDDAMMDVSLNTSTTINESKQSCAIHGLACTLKLALELNEQEILENYVDLLLKLYASVAIRIKSLVETVKSGQQNLESPLDNNLVKLLSLYINQKASIDKYLNYNLIETLSSSFKIIDSDHSDSDDASRKKALYQNLKTKLASLKESAEKNSHIYQTIINQQYASATSVAIGSVGDIKRERPCCESYSNQMITLGDVSGTIISNCDLNMHRDVLENIVHSLEKCNPLDHTKVLYLLLILKSLSCTNRQSLKNPQTHVSLKTMLPRVSCCLVRITKSVELGPSIHAFTRPGSHLSNRSIQCCTYSNCIDLYTLMFQRYPPDVTNMLIADALQIVISSNLQQYAQHSSQLHKYFIQLASAISKLLKSICIGRKEDDILKSSMPIFLSVLSNLIRCCIVASDSNKLIPSRQQNGHSDPHIPIESDDTWSEFRQKLELLAIDIGRTLTNLSFLKVKLVEYAPHLISVYVKDTQRAACPGYIKLHLDEGVFRIFNLVDAHQKERQEEIIEENIQRKTIAGKATGSMFDMIHARLDQASREVFRDLHDNYNKFHRYLGKC